VKRTFVLIACLAVVPLAHPEGTRAAESPGLSVEKHAQHRSPSSAGEGVVRLSQASLEAAGVKVAKVQTGEGRCVLKAMGKLLAPQAQTAVVSYSFPGRVAEVRTKVGDWVEKGQTVIVLESQEVGQAKSEFIKAVAAMELAKVNRDIESRLLENGTSARKGFLAAEADYKLAQVTAEAAEKRLHVLGFTEQRVKEVSGAHEIHPTVMLTAPIAGKIVASKAILGSVVDQATEILTIIDPRTLWAEAGVYEKDLAKVKVGQKVEIAVPAYPGKVFQGTVSHIGDLVDEETRTITVRTEVANGDLQLKPGMFTDVCVLQNGTESMVLVPSDAVLEEGQRRIVFVKQNDGFVRKEVETNPIEGNQVQILKGLKAGEEVVVQGNHQLKSELQRELLEAAHSH